MANNQPASFGQVNINKPTGEGAPKPAFGGSGSAFGGDAAQKPMMSFSSQGPTAGSPALAFGNNPTGAAKPFGAPATGGNIFGNPSAPT